MKDSVNDSVLDSPVRHSLEGVHRDLAIVDGRAKRFPEDVSPFLAIPDEPVAEDWAAAERLAAGNPVVLVAGPEVPPPGWRIRFSLRGLQMTGSPSLTVRPVADRVIDGLEITRLGPDDHADMLELATRTRPGPFAARTGVLGTFFGVRDGGALVAMAGERLRPPGWTEVSGVCTDAGYRGRGLARALMESVIEGVQARGERPFLHVVAENAGAIRLYGTMGFVPRRDIAITGYSPDDAPHDTGDRR